MSKSTKPTPREIVEVVCEYDFDTDELPEDVTPDEIRKTAVGISLAVGQPEPKLSTCCTLLDHYWRLSKHYVETIRAQRPGLLETLPTITAMAVSDEVDRYSWWSIYNAGDVQRELLALAVGIESQSSARWKKAAWFEKKAPDTVNTGMLERARRDGRIRANECRQPSGKGGHWLYLVSAVARLYDDESF